jgi:hypothetical protein
VHVSLLCFRSQISVSTTKVYKIGPCGDLWNLKAQRPVFKTTNSQTAVQNNEAIQAKSCFVTVILLLFIFEIVELVHFLSAICKIHF